MTEHPGSMPLANPWLDDVRPYLPGLTSREASARYGVPVDKVVKLSSNENPLGPPALAVQRIKGLYAELNRYPDSLARELRSRVADVEGLAIDNVIVGAGSSEIMSFIVRVFSHVGDEVVSMDPSFDLYSEIAVAEGRVPVRLALSEPFDLHVDAVRASLTERTKVVFVTRPNNPTSRLVPRETFAEIARLAPSAVVVSDEAYIEFADDYRDATAATLVAAHPNVIVTRTFSKAYGLSNLRIGYALGQPEAIASLMKVKPKWNVGDVAQQAAIGALEDLEHLQATLLTVREGRAYLERELDQLGLSVVPRAQANFVMARVPAGARSAAQFTDQMGRRGVLIRGDFHPEYVRVSVGTRSDNEAALQAAAAITGGG